MNAITFPFAATRGAFADDKPDSGGQLAARLESALARLVPALTLTSEAVPAPSPADRVAVAMLRSDGLCCAVDIAPELAEALVSLTLGGRFSAEARHSETLTPSERRAQRAWVTACLEAVDATWPAGESTWQPAGVPVIGTAYGFTACAGELSAAINVTVTAPGAAEAAQSVAGPRTDIAWARGMRALLGATGLPLRAVLHERQLPLAQAVQLAPGDVLPIEAPRDVQLRIGRHHIARGTIAPLGDEGALLVTIISRRPEPVTLATLGELS